MSIELINTFIFRRIRFVDVINGTYTQCFLVHVYAHRLYVSATNAMPTNKATKTCNPADSLVWMKTPHKRVLTKNIPHQRYLSSFLIVVCIFFSLLYNGRQCRAHLPCMLLFVLCSGFYLFLERFTVRLLVYLLCCRCWTYTM